MNRFSSRAFSMCGTAGIYSLNGQSHPSRATMERMTSVRNDRVSDEAGLHPDHRTWCGRAQLGIMGQRSIIQPNHNKDRRMYIAEAGSFTTMGRSIS